MDGDGKKGRGNEEGKTSEKVVVEPVIQKERVRHTERIVSYPDISFPNMDLSRFGIRV
jgi:hypothetical protein